MIEHRSFYDKRICFNSASKIFHMLRFL
jgi:hypothetical protein